MCELGLVADLHVEVRVVRRRLVVRGRPWWKAVPTWTTPATEGEPIAFHPSIRSSLLPSFGAVVSTQSTTFAPEKKSAGERLSRTRQGSGVPLTVSSR
jgi:hypothetical protein